MHRKSSSSTAEVLLCQHTQAEQGQNVSRVAATHCVDMLVDAQERRKLSSGEKVFWLTPGWILYRHEVFQDWDEAKANESFPQHTEGAILVDQVCLERLRGLLCDCTLRLQPGVA